MNEIQPLISFDTITGIEAVQADIASDSEVNDGLNFFNFQTKFWRADQRICENCGLYTSHLTQCSIWNTVWVQIIVRKTKTEFGNRKLLSVRYNKCQLRKKYFSMTTYWCSSATCHKIIDPDAELWWKKNSKFSYSKYLNMRMIISTSHKMELKSLNEVLLG